MRLFDFFRRKPAAETGAINEMQPGESLRQFHQRIYDLYPAERKAPAVQMLRNALPAETLADVAKAIDSDPENWCSPYHFGWGMAIRNLLREKGYGEDYWPIWNLDDLYAMLVEEAVRGN